MDYSAGSNPDKALPLATMLHGTSLSAKFTMHQETRMMHDNYQLTEDTSCTTKALLENVQTVYLQSMTSNDEYQKVVRAKMQADEQVQRLQEQLAKMSSQMAGEEQRRNTEATVTVISFTRSL